MELGIADSHKLVVLAAGSGNGVEVARFAPTSERLREAAILRSGLAIPATASVIGFVGRFTRDKGISELIDAYVRLRCHRPDTYLLLVGDFEDGDAVSADVRKAVARDPQIIHTGMVQDPAPYYYLMDVLALPTYREGFPNAVLEAYVAGKPVVTTRATGARDAVQDGITGTLVPVADSLSLASALLQLIESPDLAKRMGRAGNQRVQREFRQDFVWNALREEFLSVLRQKGLPGPQTRDASDMELSILP
jgi:glycosyltransferase involved in cell wall biosynthesis